MKTSKTGNKNLREDLKSADPDFISRVLDADLAAGAAWIEAQQRELAEFERRSFSADSAIDRKGRDSHGTVGPRLLRLQ